MVFCCIAIVGIAVIYFCLLWLRQLVSWPRRDKHASNLPAPPRALSGNGAWPVYGHTRLFTRMAGDVALLFEPEWKEWSCLPERFSRKLGECFAIFIWGRWRVVVKGPDRTRLLMESQKLREAWPWTPPTKLLGKSCLPFLEEDERKQLRKLIGRPLSQRAVIDYAPIFAELAERCLDDVVAGKFQRSRKRQISVGPGDETREFNGDVDDDTAVSAGSSEGLKVKWDALRSYTFDLVDGPILNMNKWNNGPTEQTHSEPSKEQKQVPDGPDHDEEAKRLLPRDRMLLWMDRMKRGLCVIKLTFGPEWMYIWIFNEYGRALNGRMHIYEVIHEHVRKMNELVPVSHEKGHSFHDPTTMPIPLLAWGENILRSHETIFGAPMSKSSDVKGNRARTRSVPVVISQSDSDEYDSGGEYVEPFTVKQDLARPRYENSPALKARKKFGVTPPRGSPSASPIGKTKHVEVLQRVVSGQPLAENGADAFSTPPPSPPGHSRRMVDTTDLRQFSSGRPPQLKEPPISILENIMRQSDLEGHGISQVVTTELSILLWMILDAGNAWTSMALNLLATDREALGLVQEELDCLSVEFGRDVMFTPSVLGRMHYLDALLYEAIRLCPAFLGGMKKTTETVELQDDGVQIGKNTNVIFCQPTDMNFDIHAALGRKPEELGRRYPQEELHGFLPLQGLEVPLMVMQSKVFLIVLLQKYSPSMSKRKTFIRRVTDAMNQSFSNIKSKLDRSDSEDRDHGSSSDEGNSSVDEPVSMVDLESGVRNCEMTQTEAMRLFTKIPFPEPRRVIHIRPRIL